ncbi:MAG: branched-chain amino acid transaminase [Vicinamibacterales bacterium]
MAAFTKVKSIWFNGKLVPWEDAKVHVLAHGLQYGTGVFEGMRCYATADGPAVFRLDAHMDRLFASAALYEMELPYSREALMNATLEVIRDNQLDSAYIRPVAFFDAHSLSVWPRGCPVTVAIAAVPGTRYLDGAERGVRVTISSIRRFDASVIPPAGKACGQYINSARAVMEALRRGFDEAILLNSKGDVAEGSGENLFVVKNGTVVTNGIDASILMGITRDSILTIAKDLGIPVELRAMSPLELPTADELFFSGTAVEVTPIRDVDGVVIGDGTPGPITRRIQQTFFDAVAGKRPEYRKWLAYASKPVGV